MYIEQVPKHVAKDQLPGLKVGALVKTLLPDRWQNSKTAEMGSLPAGSLGRVKKIYDFGARGSKGGHRFYCTIKFEGKDIPPTTFYTEELVRVRL